MEENKRIYPILINDVLVQTEFPLVERLQFLDNSFNWWLSPTIGAAYFKDKEGVRQILPMKKEIGVDWAQTLVNQVPMETFDLFRLT